MNGNIPVKHTPHQEPDAVPGFRLDIPRAALLVLLERPAAVLNIDVPGVGLVQLAGVDDVPYQRDYRENQEGYAGLSAWDVRGTIVKGAHGLVPSTDAEAMLSVIRQTRRGVS